MSDENQRQAKGNWVAFFIATALIVALVLFEILS